MGDCSAEVRKDIALLAMRKNKRFVPESADRPCVWQPTTVTNPATGIPFSPISAWHYIAELAEKGHPIKDMILDIPKGETAYTIEVELEPGVRTLYIKVQLIRGNILGRSFHYSTK